MNRLIILSIFIILFVSPQKLNAQTQIEIGGKADNIAQFVKWITNDRHGAFDIRYYNGEIAEVTSCFSNQLIYEFRMQTDFCKHYIMKNGQLESVLTQFEKMSIQQLRGFLDKIYADYKLFDYYLSEDLVHYTKIYLHENGYATQEWRKIDINEFPQSQRATIIKELDLRKKTLDQKVNAESKRNEEIKSIKSTIYSLEEYNSDLYSKTSKLLSEKVHQHLRNISRVRYSDSLYYNLPTTKYNVTFTMHEPGTNYVGEIINCSVVSGPEQGCEIFQPLVGNYQQVISMISVGLKPISIKGVDARTKASFNDFLISYQRGHTRIKINKRGMITNLDQLPAGQSLQELIQETAKDVASGKYVIEYEIGTIGNLSIRNATIQ